MEFEEYGPSKQSESKHKKEKNTEFILLMILSQLIVYMCLFLTKDVTLIYFFNFVGIAYSICLIYLILKFKI